MQSLAKDRRGTFHLSTVIHDAQGGPHFQDSIRPDSPIESIDVVVESLFMTALVEIANQRWEAQHR